MGVGGVFFWWRSFKFLRDFLILVNIFWVFKFFKFFMDRKFIFIFIIGLELLFNWGLVGVGLK